MFKIRFHAVMGIAISLPGKDDSGRTYRELVVMVADVFATYRRAWIVKMPTHRVSQYLPRIALRAKGFNVPIIVPEWRWRMLDL